jgi:hypothetical protein
MFEVPAPAKAFLALFIEFTCCPRCSIPYSSVESDTGGNIPPPKANPEVCVPASC